MNEDTLKLTDFDYLTGDHHLQMIKAALPYMELPRQRGVSVFVKLQELRRTLNLFQDGSAVSAMSLTARQNQSQSSPAGMLKAIRPYGNPQEQSQIDMLCNLIQGSMAASQFSGGGGFEALKSLLPPDQQSLLDQAALAMELLRQFA